MQKSKILRYSVIILLLIVFSIFITVELDTSVINTLYTIVGIMFSIGMSLVVTFNMQGVRNKKYVAEIRAQLNSVLNNYILFFAICTISFLSDSYFRKNKLLVLKWDITGKDELIIRFNLIFFLCLILIYSIIYFVYNFIRIQKLNNSIFDESIKADL